MRELEPTNKFFYDLCKVILCLFVVAVLGFIAIHVYLGIVASHEGISLRATYAATNLKSFRDLEKALGESKSIDSLPLATKKTIVVLDGRTSVWKKNEVPGESATRAAYPILKVRVETGPYTGMVVWVRSEDISIGGSVL